MKLRPGMKVLDVGCGVGGPAREIARFSDVQIVGLNNNAYQVGRARTHTKNHRMENQVTFVQGDFMKLSEQFGENSFDAGAQHAIFRRHRMLTSAPLVYAIEATVHAPTWEGVYGEILKVLKPGGVVSSPSYCNKYSTLTCAFQFGVYEWVMTDTWDPSIPEHKALAHAIEFGNGIPEMRPLSTAREALKAVGFQIEHEEDLAERKDVVPWYYPLEGDIFKAQTAWDYFTVWRMSTSGKFVTHNAMWVMESLGFVPKGTGQVGDALKVAANALVAGGQSKVCMRLPFLLDRYSCLRSSSLRCISSLAGNR